jgi:hypothetical protein
MSWLDRAGDYLKEGRFEIARYGWSAISNRRSLVIEIDPA